MVSKSVEKILGAEDSAADCENQATIAAAAVIAKAHKRAQEIADEYNLRADSDSSVIIENAREEAQKIIDKSTAAVEQDAQALKSKANVKKSTAVEAAIKILTK